MSWQQYVDSYFVGSGHADQGAILDVTGQGVWAQSPGFKHDANEMKAIASSFGDKNEPKTIQQNGFHLFGQKYMTITADDEVVVGKKGKQGVVIVKTTQCLLVAHHPDDVLTNNTRSTVEGVAKYLKSTGY